MDTGYPALITEPLVTPDPKSSKPSAAVNAGEVQAKTTPESSAPPVTTTPTV